MLLFYHETFINIGDKQISEEPRVILQALDPLYNDNKNCDFHSPNDSKIAFPSSDLLEKEINNCYTYDNFKMND